MSRLITPGCPREAVGAKSKRTELIAYGGHMVMANSIGAGPVTTSQDTQMNSLRFLNTEVL